jgi:hypothetical protein
MTMAFRIVMACGQKLTPAKIPTLWTRRSASAEGKVEERPRGSRGVLTYVAKALRLPDFAGGRTATEKKAGLGLHWPAALRQFSVDEKGRNGCCST